MAFFPPLYRPLGASLAVFITLFSAEGVAASALQKFEAKKIPIPDCQNPDAFQMAPVDAGTKLPDGNYSFAARLTCNLTLPASTNVAMLKQKYGNYLITRPGFTLTSVNPEQSNGDWIFTGEMNELKPYQTWITYNTQFTGLRNLAFTATAIALRGESYGDNLKAESLGFTFGINQSASKGRLSPGWTLVFDRKIHFNKEWYMPTNSVWSGVADSVKDSVTELVAKLLEFEGQGEMTQQLF